MTDGLGLIVLKQTVKCKCGKFNESTVCDHGLPEAFVGVYTDGTWNYVTIGHITEIYIDHILADVIVIEYDIPGKFPRRNVNFRLAERYNIDFENGKVVFSTPGDSIVRFIPSNEDEQFKTALYWWSESIFSMKINDEMDEKQ